MVAPTVDQAFLYELKVTQPLQAIPEQAGKGDLHIGSLFPDDSRLVSASPADVRTQILRSSDVY